jgi:hypothetical protein
VRERIWAVTKTRQFLRILTTLPARAPRLTTIIDSDNTGRGVVGELHMREVVAFSHWTAYNFDIYSHKLRIIKLYEQLCIKLSILFPSKIILSTFWILCDGQPLFFIEIRKCLNTKYLF